MWSGIVGNTTVNAPRANVLLKSTGNEKVRVSVCLTGKADGTKMKPFAVFRGANIEAAASNKNFKHVCIVSSSYFTVFEKKYWFPFLLKEAFGLGHFRTSYDQTS